MHFRTLSISLSVLAATLTLSSFQAVQAQDNPFLAPAPNQGGGGFGGGRGEGGPGGPGGGREGGREGGPGGGGPRGNNFTQREGETTEQFQTRVLAPYVELVPDLSPEQKTHIMVILQAANMESQAVRANTALSEERQATVSRQLRADIANRVKNALTEKQLVSYNEALADREAATAEMAKLVEEHPEEDMQETRDQAIKGYEDFLEELSVKQKTEVIKLLVTAQQDEEEVTGNTFQTEAQKKAALVKIHQDVNTKVTPLLDTEQRVSWKKAHDATLPR